MLFILIIIMIIFMIIINIMMPQPYWCSHNCCCSCYCCYSYCFCCSYHSCCSYCCCCTHPTKKLFQNRRNARLGILPGLGFTNPNSLDKVLEFLIYLCDLRFRRFFFTRFFKNSLQADVLELTPFRETEIGV